jgi:hypothetical protein
LSQPCTPESCLLFKHDLDLTAKPASALNVAEYSHKAGIAIAEGPTYDA